jgi:hypothetical protein
MRKPALIHGVVLAWSLLLPALALAGVGVNPSHAVLHVEERAGVADGEAFGRAGAYEKLVGTMDFALDPADPQNAIITDLDLAPRDAGGLVEYSTDFYLLVPVDRSHWNHKLVYDVNNRGNKLILGQLQDATGGNNPLTAEDFGNGFLMKQGYAILWVGWEGDRLPGENIVTIRVPVATEEDGSPIAEEFAVEYFRRPALRAGRQRVLSAAQRLGQLLQLSGGRERDGGCGALGARQRFAPSARGRHPAGRPRARGPVVVRESDRDLPRWRLPGWQGVRAELCRAGPSGARAGLRGDA